MDKAFHYFKANLEYVKSLEGINKYFDTRAPAIDLSELRRARIVLIISAFDAYVHHIVRKEIIESIKNNTSHARDLKDFNIPLQFVQRIIASSRESEQLEILDTAIKEVASKYSYQSPSNIERAFKIISISNIWHKISEKCGLDKADIKRKLGLIIRRRNKIVHEADFNMTTMEKDEVLESDVEDVLEFIELLVSMMEIVVYPPNPTPSTIV